MPGLPCVSGPVLRILKEVRTLEDEKDQGRTATFALALEAVRLLADPLSSSSYEAEETPYGPAGPVSEIAYHIPVL